jgi:hypothetical protein
VAFRARHDGDPFEASCAGYRGREMPRRVVTSLPFVGVAPGLPAGPELRAGTVVRFAQGLPAETVCISLPAFLRR